MGKDRALREVIMPTIVCLFLYSSQSWGYCAGHPVPRARSIEGRTLCNEGEERPEDYVDWLQGPRIYCVRFFVLWYG
jgi:hypothetical protein